MCVEHIPQKRVGLGERQLAAVVMTVHDKTLILTVTTELGVESVERRCRQAS
jgi:hypothetical protein